MRRTLLTHWFYLLASLAAFFVTILGCLPIALYLCSHRDTTPRGPLSAPADWPEPIRDLHSKMTQVGVAAEPFEVYLVYGRPGDTLSTVICRLAKTEEAIGFLTATLGMQKVSSSELYIQAVNGEAERRAPGGWWIDSKARAEYFASKQLLIGEEADQYVMAIDPNEDRIFIHYSFNF